jgi:hypothetical protein
MKGKFKCECCGKIVAESSLIYLGEKWGDLSYRSLVRPECKESIHKEILRYEKRKNNT